MNGIGTFRRRQFGPDVSAKCQFILYKHFMCHVCILLYNMNNIIYIDLKSAVDLVASKIHDIIILYFNILHYYNTYPGRCIGVSLTIQTSCP